MEIKRLRDRALMQGRKKAGDWIGMTGGRKFMRHQVARFL